MYRNWHTSMIVVDSNFVIFGEMHGTQEMPEFVGDYICRRLQQRGTATVGLEISSFEQVRLNAFIASEGSAADRTKLLNGSFWRRDSDGQDGRGSEAMFRLVERIRQWKQQGMDVDVLALDAPAQGQHTRDGAMAELVRSALRRRPDRQYVVMVGDVHARKGKGTPWGPLYEPMAFQLRAEHPLVIDMQSGKGGTAWVCTEALHGCGTFRYPSPQHPNTAASPVFRALEATSDKFDAQLILPGTTASPPANAMARAP
jgi:hypothetical protein